MKTIILKCDKCGEDFERALKEHTRNEKLGRKRYCGISCAAKDNKALVKNWNNPNNLKYLQPNWGKGHSDEFSSFRYYINKANCNGRKKLYGEHNLTLEFLKQLWEKQNGTCPYTGHKMDLPITTHGKHIKAKNPLRASLDRIDSSKGYIQGNVEFVCLGVNLAKASFSREQVMEFFKNIPK